MYLNLSDNHITDNSIKALFKLLSSFPAIYGIDLNNSEYLTPDAFLTIVKYMEEVSSITTVCYLNNLISQQCISKFLKLMSESPNLKHVEISLFSDFDV